MRIPLGVLRPLNVLLAALLILLAGPWWPKPAEAQPATSAGKISSLLGAQLQLKSRTFAAGGPMQAQTGVSGAPLVTAPISRQKVFLHLKEFPSPDQVAELQNLGVSIYVDSWIPPTPANPSGFLYTEIPVSSIGEVATRSYVISLQSAEVISRPKNDQAALAMNVNSLWNSGFKGAGVRVAVIDSGLDLTNPDIPTPVAKADYSLYPPNISYGSVANTYTGHGTHVTAAAVGRGVQSGGLYQGMAPEASLIFLKIGKDGSGIATSGAMAKAIKDAVDVYNAKVINMSYGTWSTYHDGTSELSQAVDYATGKGAIFFGAAGNEATYRMHYSGTVAPQSKTDFIKVNLTGVGINDTRLAFNLVWFDGPGTHNSLSLEYYNSAFNGDFSTNIPGPESPRGTESELSYRNIYPPQGNSTWYLKVNNPSNNTQFFHVYYDDEWNTGSTAYPVSFDVPDQSYTLDDPAEADTAIAVGAYVTRTTWADFQGVARGPSGQTMATIADYSSRGPRVDAGAPDKPNLVAPGSMVVSAKDSNVPVWPGYTNTNLIAGQGGAPDYFIAQGTSVASPLAAGVAALLLGKNPALTPVQVRQYLETTATRKGGTTRNNIYGWGLINAQAAVSAIPVAGFSKVSGPSGGVVPATFNFNDVSTGSVQSWWWDFGDGTTSSTQNPVKIYNSGGNYPVTLTVSNAISSSSTTQVVSTYGALSANFTRTMFPPNGVVPVTVNFTDTSSGNPTTWVWHFPDGSASTAQNPSKMFTAAGNYDVTLSVTNPAGGPSTTDRIVSVYAMPGASFTASAFSGTAPVNINFTDTSIGNPVSWLWNFGDGTTSTAQNPSKTYAVAGNYNASLTVTNPAGLSALVAVVRIYSSPAAGFSASPTVNGTGSPITFTDQSTGNPAAWSWNFGDGTTSTLQNPAKAYDTEGTYDVGLTVTNPVGSNSVTRNSYISIVSVRSETSISQGLSGGYAYVAGRISRFYDASASTSLNLGDGIGSYDAYMSYGSGISFRAASGVAPFNSPVFALNTLGGTRSTVSASQSGSAPQPPMELFRFYPALVGSKDMTYDITLRFNSINRAAGGQALQGADVVKSFQRGDASHDGKVNIVDALFIAQYLAGARTLGEGSGQIWAVNAATPKNDSDIQGSVIDIIDALYIAQMLAGLRDGFYNMI